MSHTEARRVTKQYTDIVSNLVAPERYSASVWGPLFKTSTLPTDRPSDRVGYVLYSDSGSLGSTTPVNPDDLLLLISHNFSISHPVGYYRYVII